MFCILLRGFHVDNMAEITYESQYLICSPGVTWFPTEFGS